MKSSVALPHTQPAPVLLDVIPGIYGLESAAVPIIVSAVMDDSTRVYITNASSLTITSLNESLVTVQNGIATGQAIGNGDLLTITWQMCSNIAITTTVNFEVELNLNRPIFLSKTDSFNLDEDQALGFIGYILSAIDEDAPLNAEVEYRIINSDYDDIFVVDSKTGQLSIIKPLDAESNQMYTLTFEATDFAQRNHRDNVASNLKVPSKDHFLYIIDTFEVSSYTHACDALHTTYVLFTFLHFLSFS